MAANKFATMLHRNTNKITLILVYAILEWVLIILLLLNSLFSYLIIKYADYFGLKRPCLWCSRLDHILDSKNNKNSYRDLVCDDHATEISKLGFCSNHRKLSESQDMCEDCSSSSSSDSSGQFLSKKYAFFPWMKQIGMIQDSTKEEEEEVVEVDSKCSCCGVNLERKFYSPYVLINPSWDVLDYTHKKETEVDDDGENSDPEFVPDNNQLEGILIEEGTGLEVAEENCSSSSVSNSDCKEMVADDDDDKADYVIIEKEQEIDDQSTKIASPQIATKHLEFYIDGEDCHLIPVDLMDPVSVENKSEYEIREESHGYCGDEDVILDFTMFDKCTSRETVLEPVALLPAQESEEESKAAILESIEENEGDWSSFIQAESREIMEEEEEHEQEESNVNQVFDDELQLQNDEKDAEISIGTEIPDQEPIDDIQTQEIEVQFTSSRELQEDNDDNGCKVEDQVLEFKTIRVETSEEEAIKNHLSLNSSVLNEIEEEKEVPDTPTSIDSLHLLHKKLLLLERRDSGTEESLDGGSVISDIDAGDGVSTVEKLKSAWRAERKALNALYAELEEERSASAVAASQTMAMINRLQEEKAAMQMEALQYQRMMEEQSEYDQEALQLLNELMVKREKEKGEIEKELEVYRKKVHEYEAKEKMMMLRRRSRTPSASCSNAEDSDDLSIDLNHEGKEEDSMNTPADAVLHLEDSLSNFEEERLSILEQLKILEEKLFTMNDDDEEEQHFEDIKPIEHFYNGNGNGNVYIENYDFSNGVVANGYFKEMNGKLHYQERKLIGGAKAKRLLPLFDGVETEDGVMNGNELEFDSVASQSSSVTKFELDNNNKKFVIEEEVDHVYERLQALEADREFLKHCISSLRKGDKGIYLLQEILQHLRDLRNVELRAKNIGDVSS